MSEITEEDVTDAVETALQRFSEDEEDTVYHAGLEDGAVSVLDELGLYDPVDPPEKFSDVVLHKAIERGDIK